jgi:Zn-dependent M28 family amino/carboxypeptidase
MADVRALSAIPSRHVGNPGVAQAADTIKGQMAAADGGIQAADQGFPLTVNGVETFQRNVIASLPGADPSAGAIVIGAHYDSRTRDIGDSASLAPGANDNASGVAAVIELARVLADTHPRASILLVAFTGEEIGREGSKYFVAAFSSPQHFRAMIALDIVGRDTNNARSVRIYSPGPEGSPSRRLAAFFAAQGRAALPGFGFEVKDSADRPGRYSDHISFSEAGFPAIRLIQPEEDPWNHSADDTLEKMTPGYLREVTQAVLAAVYALAWGDAGS